MDAGIPFGRYTLERPLAAGGMAEVLLASISGPEGFRKQVVVKRILPKLAQDANTTRMFLDEARLAARFNHPNLIQVYELFEVAGTYALAMEYLEGLDLTHFLRAAAEQNWPVPFSTAAQIVAEAADGLHYAHELRDDDGTPLNLVHRDISPSNIFLSWSGNVKVVDFGVAKTTSPEREATKTGVIKGKIGYLSPEQVDFGPVDRRTDVFALGIVLYETITGRRCFRSPDVGETLERIRRAEYVPVTALRPDIPDDLVHIIDHALTADVESRYPTAAALRDDLRGFLAQRPGAEPLAKTVAELFAVAGGSARERATTVIVGPSGPLTEDTVDEHGAGDEPREEITAVARPSRRQTEALAADGESGEIDETRVDVDETRPSSARPDTDRVPQLLSRRSTPPRRPRLRAIAGLGVIVSAALATVAILHGIREPESATAPPVEAVAEVPPAPTAALEIQTTPPGAEIFVDGAHVGRAPVVVDGLATDESVWVVAELEGHAPEAERVTPATGEAVTVKIPLGKEPAPRARRRGRLTLTTKPPLDAYWRGRRLGRTPIEAVRLNAGPQIIELRDPRLGIRRRLTVNVPRDGTTVETLTLRKGRAVINSVPWANVFLGPRKLGTTPLPPTELYEGTYTLRLENPEVKGAWHETLVIKAGETTKLKAVRTP